MDQSPDTLPTRRIVHAASSVETYLRRLTEIASGMGTIWFFALVILICAEVVGRAFFSMPIRGVTEIVAYSVVGATFLQIGNAFYAERMTRADFFLSFLNERSKRGSRVLEVVISLTGVLVAVLIIQAGWPKFIRAFADGELVGLPGEFSFYVWPLRLIVIFGCTLAAIALITRAIHNCAELNRENGQIGLGFLGIALLLVSSFWLFGIPAIIDSGTSNFMLGALSLGVLILLVMMGLHVGVAMILVGFVGLWLIKGRLALPYTMLGISENEYLANYYFSAVPLFVLMGLLVAASDIGRETFAVARWLTRPVKGGLGIATVGANAIFAAITGSSIASAAVFAKIATPEMIRHGYTKRFSVGVVAGSSVLGMLIPPSILLIVYGFLAEQSVGHLFAAAIVPGLILATAMCLMIWLRATFWPQQIFVSNDSNSIGNSDEVTSVGKAALMLVPVLGLIFLVLGGIYGGFFTPTEGGAVGSAGALIYGFTSGKLDRKNLWKVIVETGQIATAILYLILAANVFTVMLASSGFVQSIGGLIGELDLSLWQFAIVYVFLLVILGMFLESISIMLIVVPITLPAVLLLGGDPIWFGILTVIAVEIGLLTPPFGLTCYVVSSTLRSSGISLSDIFAGALPFVWVMALVTFLIIVFPALGSLSF